MENSKAWTEIPMRWSNIIERDMAFAGMKREDTAPTIMSMGMCLKNLFICFDLLFK